MGATCPYCGVTYVSHWAETIDVQRKLANLRGFLPSYTADEWHPVFCARADRYYYHGPAEGGDGVHSILGGQLSAPGVPERAGGAV